MVAATWRKKTALVLNFVAIVLVSWAVLSSHDAHIRDKGGAEDEKKEIDEMLRDLHFGRVMTLAALVLVTAGFVLEGYDHVFTRD